MNTCQFVTLFVFLFSSVACSDHNRKTQNGSTSADTTPVANVAVPDSFAFGRVIPYVTCKSDPGQSYALYIPLKGNKEALPVVYFFDPHGEGSLPVNKYKALADQYHFILIGSNNSKNGNEWSATDNIWNTLSNDVQERLKVTKGIYTCGFSGGAKVASYLALNHNEIKGVIVGGAGLPDGTPAGNFNFGFTAIAGEGDMNMTDLVELDAELNRTQTQHRIIFFDGKHEWSPKEVMKVAFEGLLLDAMKRNYIPKDDALIADCVAETKARINNDLKSYDLIKAERECTLGTSLLGGLTDEASWFKERDAALVNDTQYKKQWQVLENLLKTEQNMKAAYVQQFQNGDTNYWRRTITGLQARAKAQTQEGAMYQRLVAYLSLAFYSISSQFIKNNQNNEARYFVDLYKLDDPTNSEAWYFSAILDARSNDPKSTENDLLTAVENGFKDKQRIESQREFQVLGSQLDLAKIESEMQDK